MTTTLRSALGQLLPEGDLESFVRDRRRAGFPWRRITRELYDVTRVDVSYETLRTWFPDDEPEKVAG